MQILELGIGGRVRDKRKKVLGEEGRGINSQECISSEMGKLANFNRRTGDSFWAMPSGLPECL